MKNAQRPGRSGTKLEWPLIDRHFRIPDNNYAKTYGIWRGQIHAEPADAARKFVQGENQFRIMEKRYAMHQERLNRNGGPIEHAGPGGAIKMARGEPVAGDIVPTGERETRRTLGLPTHRCHRGRPLPAHSVLVDGPGPEASPVYSEVEQQEDGSNAADIGVAKKRLPASSSKPRRQASGFQSHSFRPRSYSETEKLWKSPQFSGTVPARVFEHAGYTHGIDGTLMSKTSLHGPDSHADDEFQRLSVRELMTRSSELASTSTAHCQLTPSTSRSQSRDLLRSSSGSHARPRGALPTWATVPREKGRYCTRLIGDPSKPGQTVIQPMTPNLEEADPVPIPTQWMTRVPNLGRVTDPFCLHLVSEPMYCYDLNHARHGREPHMESSGGLYRGGPVYNINFSRRIC